MKWKIHNVFHVSLLEQEITRKRRVNNKSPSEPEKEFEDGNNKEYKVELIIDSVIYSKEGNDEMLDLYYLVLWKGYPEEEST